MQHRDRWNMMGGPPGLLNLNCLAATKRKRVGRTRSAQQEDEEEEEEASDVFSRKRVLRRKRKKRSEFLRTMSDTGSESEGGQNSSYTSGLDSSCASEAEEEDCPTDPATLSMLLERFTVSSNPSIGFATFKESTVESTLEERRGLNADEASVRLYLMSLFRKLYIASHSVRYTPCYLGQEKLPSLLEFPRLVALLGLAVVTQRRAGFTLADLVRLLTSDSLPFHTAARLLPDCYQVHT